MLTLLRRGSSVSMLLRWGVILFPGGVILDGLYHFTLTLSLSEPVERYLFPIGGLFHL